MTEQDVVLWFHERELRKARRRRLLGKVFDVCAFGIGIVLCCPLLIVIPWTVLR